MKKEYHYTISRTDRIYLVSFVVILLSWELVKGVFPGTEKPYSYIPEESNTQKDDHAFHNYDDNRYKSGKSKKYKQQYDNKSEWDDPKKITPPSHPIIISKASIEELTSIGLSRKVAYNIQKYINSGGTISGPDQLLRIYGMDSVQLNKSAGHIIYPSISNNNQEEKNEIKSIFTKKTIQQEFDLNSATAEDLESLPGIGTVLSERIIKFRESLGGFLHEQQLLDCYGITPETYDKIKSQLVISSAPRLLIINETDLNTLSHPYLSKKMVRVLHAYKKQHGNFQNESDLKKVYPPDTNWYKKIFPYLSFEIKVKSEK